MHILDRIRNIPHGPIFLIIWDLKKIKLQDKICLLASECSRPGWRDTKLSFLPLFHRHVCTEGCLLTSAAAALALQLQCARNVMEQHPERRGGQCGNCSASVIQQRGGVRNTTCSEGEGGTGTPSGVNDGSQSQYHTSEIYTETTFLITV